MERLTALRVFRTAVELGSFAATARHLGLSPAAVSKNVVELETHLGVRLLHRTTRRMSVTEAGSAYYARITSVLDDLEEADGMVGALRDSPKGRLRVSAPMTMTLVRLSRAIPRFLQRYPEVSLDLQLDDRRVSIVEEGFDLAVRGTDRLEDSSLVAKRLMTMRHVVCAAPEYLARHGVPEHPEALAEHTCIKFSLSGHAHTWTFTRGGRRPQTVRQRIHSRYDVSSSLAVRDALREGLGLSLVPEVYVRDDLERGALRTVLDDWDKNETTLYAIYPSRRYVVPKVRAFIDFLVETLEA